LFLKPRLPVVSVKSRAQAKARSKESAEMELTSKAAVGRDFANGQVGREQ